MQYLLYASSTFRYVRCKTLIYLIFSLINVIPINVSIPASSQNFFYYKFLK